jgi:hypothetical protein
MLVRNKLYSVREASVITKKEYDESPFILYNNVPIQCSNCTWKELFELTIDMIIKFKYVTNEDIPIFEVVNLGKTKLIYEYRFDDPIVCLKSYS